MYNRYGNVVWIAVFLAVLATPDRAPPAMADIVETGDRIPPLCPGWLSDCCSCWLECEAILVYERTDVTFVVMAVDVANCCASCPPNGVPSAPQESECTVEATRKYSLSTNIGGSANVHGIGVQLGLGSSWEETMTAGCTQGNCM